MSSNTELVQNSFAAFGRGDIQAILDMVAPDVEWILEGPAIIPFAGTWRGVEGVAQFFQALVTSQQDPQLTIDEYIAEGDSVVTIGRYSAVVTATGKKFDSAVAYVFTFKNGKLARFLDFGDTAQAAEAYTMVSAAAA